MSKKFTNTQTKILDHLKSKSGSGPAAIAKSVGISTSTARRELALLSARGCVVRLFMLFDDQERYEMWKLPITSNLHNYRQPAANEVYTWGQVGGNVIVHAHGTLNEFGLPVVTVYAGDNKPVNIVLPKAYFSGWLHLSTEITVDDLAPVSAS